ncbi:DEAD/DEAH box helicase [Okeania sp. SIO1I7]|uniref:DEAD/DEAH box helicase n=1 Tax=Okeania sp. SIO1I7 TaxID=2607772 RepID=UPI0013F839B2|nr:DEAD/DEAH box helicase family protein [Okeania sp. SIO1I7]NET27945.1 DEAD/DEAH box helicase family protein [Okeania sp. SIO1I7]
MGKFSRTGGKSLIPIIAAANLIPSPGGGNFQGTIADKICWIVPRVNLQKQAEENFVSPYFREQLGYEHKIRANNNEPNPSKGTSGYAATYQAIVANSNLHAQEFQCHRYILVLDEFHHVEEGGSWHKALQPLVDRAVLVIMVTGTAERGDKKQIAFMPYRQTTDGMTPDLFDSEDIRVIRYTRSEALREEAIVPLHFEWGDGDAEWVDKKGERRSVDSLAEAGDYTGIALSTALKTGYARQLLTQCTDSWKSYKQINSRAKMLVLAPLISTAKEYLKWLNDLGIKAVIATSDDSKKAQADIKKFKKEYKEGDGKAVDILVTVAMAYEGLDVPAITHIACLTHIRSTPWLEQCWARAARVDREAKDLKKTGLIFMPDDQPARDCMAKIIAQQQSIIREKEQEQYDRNNGKNGEKDNSKSSKNSDNYNIPLNSNLTRSRASDLSSGETIDYVETAKIQSAMQEAGVAGSTIQMKRFLDAYNQTTGETDSEQIITTKEILTPSEEEKIIRDKIENYVRRYTAISKLEHKAINKEIFNFFRKSRKEMTFEELRRVWRWLQDRYPMNN